MNILHVLGSIDTASGGPVRSVSGLSQALAHNGHSSTILGAVSVVSGGSATIDSAQVTRLSASPLSRFWAGHSLLAKGPITDLVASADVVHIHGLWHYPGYVAARQAKHLGRPTLISPRGSLQSWGLAQGYLKKSVYARVLQRPFMENASACHALTDVERSEIEAFGIPNARIRVCPNGVGCPPLDGADGRPFRGAFPQVDGKRFILFVGRIHPKKGVDLLLQAFLTSAHHLPEDIVLVLAGPDEAGLVKDLRRQAEQRGLQHRVLFTGLLDDALTFSAMRAASFLVHPSYSEGLSRVSLEALAAGLPMVATKACNLEGIDGEIGVLVDPSQQDIARALVELGRDASQEELDQMSAKARTKAESTFSWNRIAHTMESIYSAAVHPP